jgi:hypothetical protein
MIAFECAEQLGSVDALRRELEALFAAENISPRAEHTTIPARYLKVVIAV